MTNKHTPGPWGINRFKNTTAKGNPIYERAIFTERQLKSSKFPLPLFWVCGDPGTKEKVEANARLIAAAPDLLEALEYQKKCMESSDCDFQTFLHMRDAAIAKAKGET